MQETITALEAKLAAAANAWQRALSAEAEISRLKRYRKMNSAMAVDEIRYSQRLAAARLELSALLKTPNPEMLPPAVVPSALPTISPGRVAPDVGGCFMSPCTQTGD